VAECEWRALETASTGLFFHGLSYATQIVTSSPFLISTVGVLATGIYFLSARLARWEHEVAVLRETADGERKFLVTKLRKLHTQIHGLQKEAGDEGVAHDEIKNDLRELNDMRAEHYNGVGTMPTTAREYSDQHLATKGMSREDELNHRKKKRDKRKKKRAANEDASSTE